MEYSSDFKYDLGVGKLKGETKLHTMLEDSKIEVKFDRKTRDTGNVFIEYESRGKPSGIKTTQADYWAYFIGDDEVYILSLEKLKEKIVNLNPPKVMGGDPDPITGKKTSWGFLIKLEELIKWTAG